MIKISSPVGVGARQPRGRLGFDCQPANTRDLEIIEEDAAFAVMSENS